ncbi:MAG: cupin domain-containing protein [Anaerolineales bacterium]|nr:cupin domain-containing protein [Anaerolineales bacterium]
MIAFETSALIAEQQETNLPYLEFLRRRSMSMGLYVLEAGSDDPQQPHNEDEVYVVLEGRGQLDVAGRSHAVQPGSIVFVNAYMPHHFHSITETLRVLVIFAPAETAVSA